MENKENIAVKQQNNNNIHHISSMPPMADMTFLSCTELFCEPQVCEMEVVKADRAQQQQYEMLPRVLQVQAQADPHIREDNRVLWNLLRNEPRYLPRTPDYFSTVQVEVKPHMRKIVSEWMLEVCQESCPPEVFCLGMNLMDRFLAKCRIQKSQLQLLGAVCLFLASKFKETCPLTSEKLAMYTDFSVSPEDIKEWELLVLYKLKWDLCASTGLDYLDHLLPRLPIHPSTDLLHLRRQVETAVALSSTLYTFSYTRPSILAASAIALALRSMTPRFSEDGARSFLSTLQELTQSTTAQLEDCSNALLQNLPPYLTSAKDTEETSSQILVSTFEKTSLLVKSC